MARNIVDFVVADLFAEDTVEWQNYSGTTEVLTVRKSVLHHLHHYCSLTLQHHLKRKLTGQNHNEMMFSKHHEIKLQ